MAFEARVVRARPGARWIFGRWRAKAGACALLLGCSLAGGRAFSAEARPEKPLKSDAQRARYESRELFQKAIHFIETNYVDGVVDHRKLMHGAIKGMLETLDPHSNFLPEDLYRDMKADTSGRFGGVGLEIGVKNDVLTVITPIEGTPAWRAGIRSGDRIVKIDGESTKGTTLSEAISKMRGKNGTPVSVTVYRESAPEPARKLIDHVLVRDTIKVRSVRSEELSAGYGWIRLSSFNENAAKDVREAIGRLERKGPLQGLVLDLRANPGGLLDQAVEVTSLFIDEGVVVSTIGRNPDQKEVRHARKGVARKELPLVVLVNGSSASAAEIVAGALQDHRRGIIMGQPTFGKGSVQTVVELAPEIGLKLTIARYYTPSGRSIQEKGVEPDVLVEDLDPKVLAQARRTSERPREKDLKGHITDRKGTGAAEFTLQELDALSRRTPGEAGPGRSLLKGLPGGEGREDEKNEDEDDAPLALNPREDYQVQSALNYLRSFETFRRIAGFHRGERVLGAPPEGRDIASVSPSAPAPSPDPSP